MLVEMQKESEADSGLYSDINRSLGRRKKRMFFYFINQAPAETESPNVFDEPVASERPSNLSVPVATLNPAIQERCSKISLFRQQDVRFSGQKWVFR